jgi:hypothetical protein
VLEGIGVPHLDRRFQVGTLLAEVAGRLFATIRRIQLSPSLLPNKQPWNYHGFANNMVQRIPVEVRSPIG